MRSRKRGDGARRATAGPEERWVLRAADQRAVDERAAEAGVEEDRLMENAGTNAADWIARRLRPRRAVTLSGPGGNGGDGLVVARRLHEGGTAVTAFVAEPLARCRPATRRMAEKLEDAGAAPPRLVSLETLAAALDEADCVVDALFGSGLTRPLAGEAARLVEAVNEAGGTTVSLDLPSGLPSDCGELWGPAVRADVTLAMAFLKPSHVLYPAAEYCGNTAVVSVAYPDSLRSSITPWARVCERTGIRRRLPGRRPDGHKGSFGRVLVVAGSSGMTGAAILCARGALRAGAGLVQLAGPASCEPVFATVLPEAITLPLPCRDGHIRDLESARFLDALGRADVLAVGPGLSQEPETFEAVRALIGRFRGPVVVDADGLRALVGERGLWSSLAGRAILTPHPGEMAALTGETPERVLAARRDCARAFALDHRVVLVLKGRPTAIALPDGDVYLNPTGNDGLATGGSGDVLTGLIAGFAAGGARVPDVGGAPLADAAICGAYVHGLAAEVFARASAARAMLPSDLLETLPEALWEIERCA